MKTEVVTTPKDWAEMLEGLKENKGWKADLELCHSEEEMIPKEIRMKVFYLLRKKRRAITHK